MLKRDNCVLVIIDIQEKLLKAVYNPDFVLNSSVKIAKAASILNIPTIITEQYPKGLGYTVKAIKTVSANINPIEKTAFSAMKEEKFYEQIKSYGKKQILICGIETHICVLQTAAELSSKGYEVYVLKDACSSRKEFEHNTGIELLTQYGSKITCSEIAIFEWLESSKHPNFKKIQALIK